MSLGVFFWGEGGLALIFFFCAMLFELLRKCLRRFFAAMFIFVVLSSLFLLFVVHCEVDLGAEFRFYS